MTGNELRALRKTHRLTQIEFGILLDIREATVGNWEAKDVLPLHVEYACKWLFSLLAKDSLVSSDLEQRVASLEKSMRHLMPHREYEE